MWFRQSPELCEDGVGGLCPDGRASGLAGGNGALDGAEEGDELGVRVLELEASGQLDRLLGWE
jgi:hypothetical protein